MAISWSSFLVKVSSVALLHKGLKVDLGLKGVAAGMELVWVNLMSVVDWG